MYVLYAVHFLSYCRSRNFFLHSSREVFRDFPFFIPFSSAYSCLVSHQSNETASKKQANRARQAQERRRLEREHREVRDALRRARLYLEESIQQREEELKNQGCIRPKTPTGCKSKSSSEPL